MKILNAARFAGLVLVRLEPIRSRPVAALTTDTVQDLVGARLDRLGPQPKRVVQVASALGRQFGRTHLLELLDGEAILFDDVVGQGLVRRFGDDRVTD